MRYEDTTISIVRVMGALDNAGLFKRARGCSFAGLLKIGFVQVNSEILDYRNKILARIELKTKNLLTFEQIFVFERERRALFNVLQPGFDPAWHPTERSQADDQRLS